MADRRCSAAKYIMQKYFDNGIKEITFDSEAALYHFVRKMDYVSHTGAKGNHVLEATMTSPSDSRRHKKLLYDTIRNRRLFEKCQSNHKASGGCKLDFYSIGYLIKDENGRVIDLRIYKDDLYRFDFTGYDNLLRKIRSIEHKEWWAKREPIWEAKWEKSSRLTEGKSFWDSLKQFHTTPERRNSCDSEHKPFLRGKRRKLPEPWGNEKPIRREKTWKARTKVKRQWLANSQDHVDTVQYEKRVYADDQLT